MQLDTDISTVFSYFFEFTFSQFHNILLVVAGGLPDSLSLSLGLEVGEALPVEAGMIGVVGIAFLQVLVILCCMWSVHISAFLTCTRVDNVKVGYHHPIIIF